jgi:hypothetical protein
MVGYETCDISREDMLHVLLQVTAIDWIATVRYPTVVFVFSFLIIPHPELL